MECFFNYTSLREGSGKSQTSAHSSLQVIEHTQDGSSFTLLDKPMTSLGHSRGRYEIEHMSTLRMIQGCVGAYTDGTCGVYDTIANGYKGWTAPCSVYIYIYIYICTAHVGIILYHSHI